MFLESRHLPNLESASMAYCGMGVKRFTEATLECVVAGGDYGHESLEARRLDFVECSSDMV